MRIRHVEQTNELTETATTDQMIELLDSLEVSTCSNGSDGWRVSTIINTVNCS